MTNLDALRKYTHRGGDLIGRSTAAGGGGRDHAEAALVDIVEGYHAGGYRVDGDSGAQALASARVSMITPAFEAQ